MEVIGYILDIAEVLVIAVLVWQIDRLKKRIEKLEDKCKKDSK